jgi:hypothetical protein
MKSTVITGVQYVELPRSACLIRLIHVVTYSVIFVFKAKNKKLKIRMRKILKVHHINVQNAIRMLIVLLRLIIIFDFEL